MTENEIKIRNIVIVILLIIASAFAGFEIALYCLAGGLIAGLFVKILTKGFNYFFSGKDDHSD